MNRRSSCETIFPSVVSASKSGAMSPIHAVHRRPPSVTPFKLKPLVHTESPVAARHLEIATGLGVPFDVAKRPDLATFRPRGASLMIIRVPYCCSRIPGGSCNAFQQPVADDRVRPDITRNRDSCGDRSGVGWRIETDARPGLWDGVRVRQPAERRSQPARRARESCDRRRRRRPLHASPARWCCPTCGGARKGP